MSRFWFSWHILWCAINAAIAVDRPAGWANLINLLAAIMCAYWAAAEIDRAIKASRAKTVRAVSQAFVETAAKEGWSVR